MTVREMREFIAGHPDDMHICLREITDTTIGYSLRDMTIKIWYEYLTVYADGVQEGPTEYDTMPKGSESSFPCLVLGSY